MKNPNPTPALPRVSSSAVNAATPLAVAPGAALLPIIQVGGHSNISENARLVSMLRKVEPVVFSSGGAALYAELTRVLDATLGGMGRLRA